MKLLTIEYQKGHTSYEERAQFLVFKNWGGGHRAPVAPLFRSPWPQLSYQFDSSAELRQNRQSCTHVKLMSWNSHVQDLVFLQIVNSKHSQSLRLI